MLSRVADAIYWMNRYLERADNIARFIDVNIFMMMEMGLERGTGKWIPLVEAAGEMKQFNKLYPDHDQINIIKFLTFDSINQNSILSCIEKARENARSIREIIPVEQWQAINELYHQVQRYSRKRQLDDLQPFYSLIKKTSHLYAGYLEDTMSHDQAWHFARLGCLLERADQTSRMLDVKYFLLLPAVETVGSPYDNIEWGAVLKSANAFQMYRKKYHRVNYKNVVNFLMFDKHFPRSIVYCIHAAMTSLNRIVLELDIQISAEKEMKILADLLHNTDATTVLTNGLHEFIDILQYNLNIVDKTIYQSFFNIKDVACTA
jgi:uncharacterized alpha-E superfamily protein